MSEEDWSDKEGERTPYPYRLDRDTNGGLMPVRIEDGQLWRFTYGSYESPPPRITTREDDVVKVGESTKSKTGTLGSIDDLLRQKNSLHRSKNVPALNETRFRTRAPKSFNPEAVLDRMLELLSDNETNFQRYADVIKQDGLEKVKEYIGKGIRDKVRQVCTDAPWSKESLVAIEGDIDTKKAGNYMHIIWLKDDPAIYWLYVGQSFNVKARLTQHRNPIYRAQNPSLHYHVLDSQSTDDVFVNLSEPSEMDIKNSNLYLNMLEMWCCLLFQTLPEKGLKHWLLPEVECPEYGQHLNIALPLYQFRESDNDVDSRAAFSEFRYSKDKAFQDHYWSVVRAWHALRHSNDPVKRAIYWQQRALIPQAPRIETVRQKKMQSFLQDRHIQVKQRGGETSLVFKVNNRKVAIPARLECETKYPVHVQLDLAEGDQRHPQPYAVLARDDDVAKRLGIRITFRDRADRDREAFLESRGPRCVHQINSTVDRILDVPNKVIVNTPRRERVHYPRRNVRSYTEDVVDDGDEVKWTKEMEEESDPESE